MIGAEFQLERQILWDAVLPKLRRRFLPEELEIQLIDIHQGETLERHLDGRAFGRHLEIIRDCHRISVGPFFLVIPLIFMRYAI